MIKLTNMGCPKYGFRKVSVHNIFFTARKRLNAAKRTADFIRSKKVERVKLDNMRQNIY